VVTEVTIQKKTRKQSITGSSCDCQLIIKENDDDDDDEF